MSSLEKDISSEKLPSKDVIRGASHEEESIGFSSSDFRLMSEEEVTGKLEAILLEHIQNGDKLALFQLGQLYYEQEDYQKAAQYFEQAVEKGDFQAMFQLGVMYYDGLGGLSDQEKGIEYMRKIAESSAKQAQHLKYAALYNLGRAYYQGTGVQQSYTEAERYWLLAADDGNPQASIKAQTMLGLHYASVDFKNLKKSFFWHSEACGNGSLESQGALGVMYLNGLGCKRDLNSAFICLREAADRGNVYAMGHLVSYYYRRKLFTKTVELAARVSQLDNPEHIAAETDCLTSFVSKGIAMACFYYARCLHLGLGIKKNEELAKQFYSKCYHFDPDLCAQLQSITQKGEI